MGKLTTLFLAGLIAWALSFGISFLAIGLLAFIVRHLW